MQPSSSLNLHSRRIRNLHVRRSSGRRHHRQRTPLPPQSQRKQSLVVRSHGQGRKTTAQIRTLSLLLQTTRHSVRWLNWVGSPQRDLVHQHARRPFRLEETSLPRTQTHSKSLPLCRHLPIRRGKPNDHCVRGSRCHWKNTQRDLGTQTTQQRQVGLDQTISPRRQLETLARQIPAQVDLLRLPHVQHRRKDQRSSLRPLNQCLRLPAKQMVHGRGHRVLQAHCLDLQRLSLHSRRPRQSKPDPLQRKN